LVERGRVRLQHCWEVFDRALEGRDYLVGGRLTLADIDLYVAMSFAGWVREKVPASATNLVNFQSRMKDALSA